jgi:hypothetical protein
MSGCEIKTGTGSAAYVPAERLFAVPLLEQKADDVIDMVLRVGDKFKSIGNLDEAIAVYEHFIKKLKRYIMVPLSRVVDT